MKKFFLNLLSSFMGAWLAIVTSGICLFLVCIGIMGVFMSQGTSMSDRSVLKIDLKGELIERESGMEFDLMSLLQSGQMEYQTVETLVNAIREARNNDKIKAIYLDCGALAAAPASIDAVREALVDFKSSGKRIYAYADHYSQSAYFLATVANELYLNPVGSVDLHGLGGETLFYKDLFDKIGVEFQVVRVGEGKSAVEPYTQTHMSDYARNQSMQLLDTIWAGIKSTISESRKISSSEIDSLINKDFPALRTASYAKQRNLIDGMMYRHEFEKHIADAVGQKDGLENTVSPRVLADLSDPFKSMGNVGGKQIAVLYACGGIDTEMEGGIQSQKLVEQIISLGKDENVKGLVLRVNSPGGSAYGSEQIWEAIEWFKKQKKPVAVSMGDYAASGGYYISCGANRIFADRLTITGSIGIFGLIPNIHGLTQMIGINPEMVATNPLAQFPTLLDSLDNRQLAAMQTMVEEGYELFVKRCAEGRNLPVDKIKSIADGRPLAATVARSHGLVDQLGSLHDAVEWTAGKAGIGKDYNVGVYPVLEPNILYYLNNMNQSTLPASLQTLLGGRTWDAEMVKLLNRILHADRLKAEYNLVRIKM